MSLTKIQKLFNVSKNTTDDIFDRLSHHWSVLILGIFVILASFSDWFGERIHCWCPAEFTDTYTDYTETICFIENTHYIPLTKPIPLNEVDREKEEIEYYQWVPFILVIQLLLFKLPNFLWSHLHTMSGIDLTKIAKRSESSLDDKDKATTLLVEYIYKWLRNNQQHQMPKRKLKMECRVWNKYSGNFLFSLCFVIKLLYMLNAVGQFFLLNTFLGSSFHLLGVKFMAPKTEVINLDGVVRFPRAVLCDFKLRQQSNIQLWTVQCIVSVNLFNERIFVVMWFLLLMVSILTFIGIINYGMLSPCRLAHRSSFVGQYLKQSIMYDSGNRTNAQNFIEKFLGKDGKFVLRVIDRNSSGVFVGDVIVELWKLYKDDNLNPIPSTLD